MNSKQSTSSLDEVAELVRWILRDPERPPIRRAIRPIASQFLSALFQGVAFAVVIGYLSLSANDWKFEAGDLLKSAPSFIVTPLGFAEGAVFDLTPTPVVVLSVIVLFAALYITHIALSASGASRLIDLGYEYQSASARRLVNRYKENITQSGGSAIDAKQLISIINSEARYLGRGLTILYTSLNALLTLTIGLSLLTRTAPLIVLGGVIFVVTAFLAQTLVMSFAIKASRALMAGSGPNASALAKIVQSVTVSPAAFTVTSQNVDRWFTGNASIRDYDMAYQRRLKVGVLSQLVTNLAFVCALIIIFFYLIGGVGAGQISSTNAFADIVIFRFVFGGAVGLLGGFVSFVSLKPYFDNYLSYIDHVEVSGVAPDASPERPSAIEIVGANGEAAKANPGEIISICMNGAAFSWSAAVTALDICLTDATRRGIDPKRDIALVTNEFPLIENDPFRSADLPRDLDWDHAKTALNLLSEDIEGLRRAFTPDMNEASPDQRWNELTPRHFVALSLLSAWARKTPIIYAAEGALRALPERERIALVALFPDAVIFSHYSILPAFSMRPFAKRFLILSPTAVVAELDPTQVEHAPRETVAIFNATAATPALMLQDETV